MTNQYVWLQKNLERYSYNTDEANDLYSEFKALNVADGESVSEEKKKRLEECYDRFIKLFNNNPIIYKNGLKDYGIETSEYDCYFVKSNEGMMPIGYYSKAHPVECVILLNQKAEKQKNRTLEEKHKTVTSFKQEVQEITGIFNTRKKEKKAGFIRGTLALVSGVLLLWYAFSFLRITNILNIITSIGNVGKFTHAVRSGMLSMPVFPGSGVAGWFLILIIHLIFAVASWKILKKVKKEYVLAYQKNITSGIVKKSEAFISDFEKDVDSNIDSDTQLLYDAARKGTEVKFEQSVFARGLKKMRTNLVTAKQYLEIKAFGLRSIQSNFSVFIMLLMAFLCFFSYTLMADDEYRSAINRKYYDLRIYADNFSLRSRKLIQTRNECDVHKSAGFESDITHHFPMWTDMELRESKEYDGVIWHKIRKITENEIIDGWVCADDTVAYNGFDSSAYSEIPIAGAQASSTLGDPVYSAADYAIDWNRATSWYDGNPYSPGEGESITLNLSGKSRVDLIRVFPGNSGSEEAYINNERIKTAKISFSDGESVLYEFDDNFYEEYQTVWLNKPVETDFIKIEIIDTYEGDNLCIGEIHAYCAAMNQ